MVEFKAKCDVSFSGVNTQESSIQHKIDSMIKKGFEPISIGLNDEVTCVLFRKG